LSPWIGSRLIALIRKPNQTRGEHELKRRRGKKEGREEGEETSVVNNCKERIADLRNIAGDDRIEPFLNDEKEKGKERKEEGELCPRDEEVRKEFRPVRGMLLLPHSHHFQCRRRTAISYFPTERPQRT
jgi:hypothetical protein